MTPLIIMAVATAARALAPLQSTPSASPSSSVPEDIIVEGRTANALDRFIKQLTQTRQGRQVARWNNHICLRILGLDNVHDQYITQRIINIAREVKINVSAGHCRPNILVIVTEDADRFIDLLIKRYPTLFQNTKSGVAFLRRQKEELRRSRPVRWINASRTDSYALYTASRLTEPTQESTVMSMVIVNPTKMEHLTWSQLADYLVMVTLANPSMTTQYNSTTILSMFQLRDKGASTPPSLTTDDRAVLHAIYGTSANVSASMQREQIRSAVTHPKK